MVALSNIIGSASGSKRGFARRAFSLIELVVVIVIIGIIAAIAIPRMSKGASGANESALKANVAILNNAIDLYAQEHDGTYPTVANISTQLTLYSKADGTTHVSDRSGYPFGPYLRSVPTMPVPGAGKNGTGFAAPPGPAAAAIGWLYDATNGTVTPNL